MPGFIIHLAEATIIMEHMEKKIDAVWRQEFMLGNLLPDKSFEDEGKEIGSGWLELQ